MRGLEAEVKGDRYRRIRGKNGNGGSRRNVIVKECLVQKRVENQRHILQIGYILARMRALEGRKQERDESQDEKGTGRSCNSSAAKRYSTCEAKGSE